MKPNMRLLKPNFSLKPSLQKNDAANESFKVEPQQTVEKDRVISLKPFRPPSARKEQIRESQQMDESLTQVSQPSQARRTPVNGIRRFNPQNQSTVVNLEENLSSQFQGPTINLFANKEKIDQKMKEIQQQELREKVQVKIQQKPLKLIPEVEKSTENLKAPQKKGKLRPQLKKEQLMNPAEEEPKEQQIEQGETIKIAELLGNKQQDNHKTTREIIQEQQEKTKADKQVRKRKLDTVTIEQENELINKDKKSEEAKTNKQVQQQEEISNIPEYQDKPLPQLQVNKKNISLSKKEEQQKRVKDLQNLLTLEIDDYSNQLVIQAQTPYEGYFSLIKAGVIQNIGIQSFDDVKNEEIQVDLLETNDFTNQCPEDYNRTFLETKYSQKGNNYRLGEFIQYACEIMEEIIQYKDKDNKEEQIGRSYEIPMNIRKQFETKAINIIGYNLKNNNIQLFQVCYIENKQINWMQGSIIICWPQEIYLYCNSQVTSISVNGDIVVVGTSHGHIVGWNLKEQYQINKYSSKFLEQLNIKVKTPNFSSEWNMNIVDQFGDNQIQNAAIQQISFNKGISYMYELYSMDIFGQTYVWQIQELRYEEIDKKFVELGIKQRYCLIQTNQINKQENYQKLYQSFKQNQDNILICGPNKVVNLISQQQYYDNTLQQPNYINLYDNYIIIGYSDGTIKIFYKDYSNSIAQFRYSMKQIIFIDFISSQQLICIDIDRQIMIIDIINDCLIKEWQIGQEKQIINNCFYHDNQYIILLRDGLKIIVEQIQIQRQRVNSDHLDQLLMQYGGI